MSIILKGFELNSENHFIAMEYYYLILNRTFLILLTDEYLIGLKANGVISAYGGDDLSQQIVKPLIVEGDLANPYAYLKEKYIRRFQNEDILDERFLLKNKTNFAIKRADIKSVYYDSKKKWGMGPYPHDGKVYIKTFNGKKKEFIILGNQSGEKIANLIMIPQTKGAF